MRWRRRNCQNIPNSIDLKIGMQTGKEPFGWRAPPASYLNIGNRRLERSPHFLKAPTTHIIPPFLSIHCSNHDGPANLPFSRRPSSSFLNETTPRLQPSANPPLRLLP